MRDPIHGFVVYDDWERDVINHSAFQRLRKIRQLGLTEFIYPGATHTRFEHALGTMHVATLMFDAIVRRQESYLKGNFDYDDSGLRRDKKIVRFAALLHDIGHSPFSHSGETLFPIDNNNGRQYQHEDYSAAIIRKVLRDVIEGHQTNLNYEIRADDVADLIDNLAIPRTPSSARRMIWKPLISGQLDADRCDYLLRDSLHAGVSYGQYDLNRIIDTITLGLNDSADPVPAIEQGGWHAAEGLIVARYMMFTQVYFQRTRVAFDHHIEECLANLLSSSDQDLPSSEGSRFPLPNTQQTIEDYLLWDDWKVLGRISSGDAGEHGDIIKNRTHCRQVHGTDEIPTESELDIFDEVLRELGDLVEFVGDSSRSWYTVGSQELRIVPDSSQIPSNGRPLSTLSRVVEALSPVAQRRIYVMPANRAAAEKIVREITGGDKS